MDVDYLKTLSTEIIHSLALDNNLAFVSYRLPGETEPVTMFQWKQNPAVIDDIAKITDLSGFVFSPFDSESGLPTRLIQPDMIIKGDEIISQDIKLPSGPCFSAKSEKKSQGANYISTFEEFALQVESIRQGIATSKIRKVVLSRIVCETKDKGFESSRFFHALEQAYPDALVFSLFIPDVGLWFGASPEPLLLYGDGEYSTVSLAGTRPAQEQLDKPWGEKEIDEQNIVTQYINQLLEKHKIHSAKKTGPYSYRAGNIEHLKTAFSFPAAELKITTGEFLKELHPTPSVCGLPKDLSMDVIRDTEKHQREYYSGFLGPVNTDNQWNLYVNLRSMKIINNRMEYFLGAGITRGSDASKEWEETSNKMNTLKTIVESLKKV